MAGRDLPSSRGGAADGTADGSNLSANELDLVRELMRRTRRQDGDGADQVELDGQHREAQAGQRPSGADAGEVVAELHCPRCRLAVPSDGRRFGRARCPRCASGLDRRPAPLFRSPLPSGFRAAAGTGGRGAGAADAPVA